MKVSIFDADESERQHLQKLLGGHELSFSHDPISLENAGTAKDSDAVVIFVHSHIDQNILKRLPKLKLIATMSTGYDHIDLKACKKRGIAVCNVPGYGEITVAEHTFALLLAISRKIVPSVERTRRGDFSLEGLTGFDLNGKMMGIIGTGRIGAHVAKLAHCFGMNILAYSKHKNAGLERLYGVKYVKTLNELLKNSDIISLHAPLSDETFHMINKRNIRQIKKGAVLLNTSRGALVETEALLEALKKGIISLAGLDVLEEECSVKEEKELLSKTFMKTCDLKTVLANHILIKQERVVITPHNGFNSTEALENIAKTTAENVNSFFKGKKANIVE